MERYTDPDKYLFHGSPYKFDTLIPNQAIDSMFEAGCQFAVYATSNKYMAICFALGNVEEKEDAERIMMPEYGNKMVFKNCHPNYGQKGYVYVLDKELFTHAMGSQYVSYENVRPIDIIEINVDDYLDLCIIEKD